MTELYQAIYQAILQADAGLKCQQVEQVHHDWQAGTLGTQSNDFPQRIDEPGRPPGLRLVDPRQVPRRSLATEAGRTAMLHAIAHIEFNAINLALDAAYRFRAMPENFVSDWLQVAKEEARHFQLLNDYLHDLGSAYGELAAHNGLWDMAGKTRHEALHRMALVPRVMEARGLDVTPGLIDRFQQAGDLRAVEILQLIYTEEIGHVAIGNHWYHYCCQQRGLEPRQTFRYLIGHYFNAPLRGPFNHDARLRAGFAADEITLLEHSL